MGDELQSLYVLLNDLLAGQGIAPAAYGVIASPESKSAIAVGPEKTQAVQAAISGQFVDLRNGASFQPEIAHVLPQA